MYYKNIEKKNISHKKLKRQEIEHNKYRLC